MALIDSSDVELRIAASTSGQQQVVTLAAELDELASKGGEAAPQFAALAAELRKLDNQQSLIQQFTQLKKETGEAGKALEEAQTRAQRLGREMANTENPSRKLTTEFNRSRKEVKEAADALQQKRLALQNVRGAMNTAGVGTTELAQKQAGLRTAMESATSRARDMTTRMTSTGRETAGAGREIEKAGRASDATGKKLHQMGQQAERTGGLFSSLRARVAAVGATILTYFGVRMFRDATGSAADFEEQMSKVGAVTRASAEDMRALQAAADRAGTETRYTATEAAQALENLARAGFNATESVASLPGVLALAQANGVELAEASSLVTRAIRGMGLQVSDAGRVADVLTEAAARANTTVTGLGQALAYAAPNAQSLGLTLEETVAIIGKFADAGIDASRAGTALSAILAQFSDPSSKFRNELAAAGITTGNFNDALRQLAEAGPRGARAIIAVGREAGPALRALLAQGIDSLADLSGALDNAEGASARAAATMDKNLRGAWRGWLSAWDAGRRALVEPLLEPLAEQVRGFSDRMRALVSSGSITRFGESVAAAFSKAVKWVGDFIEKVDFSGIKRALDEFATTGRAQLGALGDTLGRAGDQITLVVNTFKSGGAVVMGVIFKIAESFAGVVSNIIALAGGVTGVLARMIPIGAISEKMSALTAEIKLQAGAIWAVSEEFAARSSAAFDTAVDASSKAADAWTRLNSAVDKTAASTTSASDATQDLAENSAAAVARLEAMGEGFEYVNGTVQLATDSTKANTDAVKNNAAALDEATAKAEQVASAFARLGVESTAALQQTAANARRDFQTIRDSGEATARDIQAAFTAYAEKAVAANAGVVSEVLRAEAAQVGLKIAADEAGRVTVQSMREAAAATAALREESEEAANAVAMIGQAADAAASAVDGVTSSIQGARAASSGSGGAAGWDFTDVLREAERVGGDALRERALDIINSAAAQGNRARARGVVGAYQQSEESLRAELQRLVSVYAAAAAQPAAAAQTSRATAPTTPVRRVELVLNGRTVPLDFANQDSADRLVRELEALQRTAA